MQKECTEFARCLNLVLENVKRLIREGME